jgi:hypothetical protein
MSIGRELLFCLQNLTCLVFFGACVEVGWRFEHRTFYIGSWRTKLILTLLGMPKWVWSSTNQYRMFYVQTSTLPPHMHQKLTKHVRFCKQNNQLPTKTHVELKDNSNVAKLWNAIMKQKLRLFAIHQIVTSLQRTANLNPRIKWHLALDESNRMKSTYFTIHPSKNPPPQNGCRLKSVFFFKALVSHPPLSQFNWTFHKTNWSPLH